MAESERRQRHTEKLFVMFIPKHRMKRDTLFVLEILLLGLIALKTSNMTVI